MSERQASYVALVVTNELGVRLLARDDWPAFRDCCLNLIEGCSSEHEMWVLELLARTDEVWRARMLELTGRGNAAIGAMRPDATCVAVLTGYLDYDRKRTCAIVRHVLGPLLHSGSTGRDGVSGAMWDLLEKWARDRGAAEVVVELGHAPTGREPGLGDLLRDRGYRPTGRRRPGMQPDTVEEEWSKDLRAARQPVPVGAGGQMPALF